jgi:hypothetical protein
MRWSKITIKLTEEQHETIKSLKKSHQKNWKIFRRLKAIEMRNEGEKIVEIMSLSEASWDSVTRWFKLYNEKWIEWLCKIAYEWRRLSEYEKYKDNILEMIDEKIYGSYKELHNDISKRFAITTTQNMLRRFCKKNWIWVIRSVQ